MSEPTNKPKGKVNKSLVASVLYMLFYIAITAPDYDLLTIPNESELSYTSGKLESNHPKILYLYIDPDGTGKDVHRFVCTHEFFVWSFIKDHAGSCGSLRYGDYLNKEVTAGWYIPKDFLGFKGEARRLTSLEVDGEMVWSRDDSVRNQHRGYRFNFYFFAFSFFVSTVMYWMNRLA